MPTNPYFAKDAHAGEYNVFEGMMIEAIQIFGYDVKYIPREIVKANTILNEVTLSQFKGTYTIETYIESLDDYEGDGHLMARFGLEIRNAAKLSIAKKRFKEIIPAEITVRPREGDLIYFPMMNSLFEIRFVNGERPFYQFGKSPVWHLSVELFEYKNEKIDTGDVKIDFFEEKHGYHYVAKNLEFATNPPEIYFNRADRLIIKLPTGILGLTSVISADPLTNTIRIRSPKWNDGRPHAISAGTTLSLLTDINLVVLSLNGNILKLNEASLALGEVLLEATLTEAAEQSDKYDNNISNQNDKFDIDELLDWSELNPLGEFK